MHLHMDMASAAGINAWNDRLQPIPTLVVSKLMTTQAKARVIVFAAGIRVPEIEHCSRQRNAARGHRQTGKNQVAPFDTWFAQGTPFRGARFKIRALAFLGRRLARRTCRRRLCGRLAWGDEE